MPSLILLNGPPAIGKSTLSALWARRHPGTLNLDIDALHQFVGGWQDDLDGHAHDILRPVAKAMAATHLAGGRDVVLPQFLARIDEIEAFERIAAANDARFVEVVLLDDRADAIARFGQREVASDWDAHNRDVVANLGGADFLASMYDRLVAAIAQRPATIVVRSKPGQVEATYAAIAQALSPRDVP